MAETTDKTVDKKDEKNSKTTEQKSSKQKKNQLSLKSASLSIRNCDV